jgi:hypothetical protein
MSQAKLPQQQLRGTLLQKGPGARGIEHAARNPQCTRLTALLLAGVRPNIAMKEVFGEEPQEALSPFAFAIGNQVERAFLKDDAVLLRDLYQKANRLNGSGFRVATITEANGGASALQQTQNFLQQKLSGDPEAPNLIIKPRFLLSIASEEYEVEPDALIASDKDTFYRPIEIKSYADRGGKTDPAAVRGACRQLAVGVVALQKALESLGVSKPARLTPAIGDLILRASGSTKPTLREMLLRGEVFSLQRFLRSLPKELAELLSKLPGSGSLADAKVLESIPNNYRADCREFCALAPRCKQQAFACGSLSILGESAKDSLSAAGNLGRVIELLRHEGVARSSEEEKLVERLREVALTLKEACPNV